MSASGTVLAFGSYAPSGPQALLIAVARRSFLRRGEARRFVTRLLARLRPGPLDVRFNGVPFRVHLGDNATESAIACNESHNQAELDFLRRNVTVGGIFVDVGANVGLYSLVIAQSKARVVSIEPHPILIQRLRVNAGLSPDGSIEIVPLALGEREGVMNLRAGAANLGATKLDAAGFEVELNSLLAVLRRLGVDAVDALKIDVEGHEESILLPFFGAAPKRLWPRAMVIEQRRGQPHRVAIVEMVAKGYVIRGQTRNNTLLERSTATWANE